MWRQTREVVSWIIMLNLHRGAETATQKCVCSRPGQVRHNAMLQVEERPPMKLATHESITSIWYILMITRTRS